MLEHPEIFLVAGEESANQYASHLIKEFSGEGVRFSGIGFSNLKEQNFNMVYDAENLAVMGVVEVLAKYKKINEAFRVAVNYIKENKPKVVVLIDFGGFNLRLARKIKESCDDVSVLYFISPKLWAWGEKRALKVKKYVDQVFVIHPFEVEFYKKWGVKAKFVGHPLLDELRTEFFDKNWKEKEKLSHGISRKKILGVLLGSRERELNYHAFPFSRVAFRIKEKHQDVEVVFIIPPSKKNSDYENLLKESPLKDYKILKSKRPMDLIALCDLCLVASGTATLQVGLLGIPMAIGYIMNPITMYLFKKFSKVKFAGLVNIISEKEVSREFLQKGFNEDDVFNYLENLLENKKDYNTQKNKLNELRDKLGKNKVFKKLKVEIEKYF